jgi:hypothetical protein
MLRTGLLSKKSLALTPPSSASLRRSTETLPKPVQTEHPLLTPQRTIGNQAVLRRLQQRTRAASAGVNPLTGGADQSIDHHLTSTDVDVPARIRAETSVQSRQSGRFDFSCAPVSAAEPGEISLRSQPEAARAPKLIQPKLDIGAVDDPFERQADRVAEHVMRMPAPDLSIISSPRQLSCKCSACLDEGAQTFRGRSESGAGMASGTVQEVLRSPGQPLDPPTRAFFESRFDQDLSHVRVHVDDRAAASADAMGAVAYTVGSDIAFGAGRYAPNARSGKRLLAHELTHVMQQTGSAAAATNVNGRAGGDVSQSSLVLRRQVEGPGPDILSEGLDALGAGLDLLSDLSDLLDPTKDVGKNVAGCTPGSGIPSTDCAHYSSNAWWLPKPYINNATCACQTTPDSPTASCVRKFLKDRLIAKPMSDKILAAAWKSREDTDPVLYFAFVQLYITPDIYQDHVDAYKNCCCPSGPADYPAWIGVTSIPLPCGVVGAVIRLFGSCHGNPGIW